MPEGTAQRHHRRTFNGAVVESLADATVRRASRRHRAGDYPRQRQTPEALGAYHKVEIEKWWPIVKAAGIKVE